MQKQTIKKAGRPAGKNNARARLLLKARELFTSMPYDKVSTRLIAQKADINPAMIRYYFGSKEGLFEEMVRDYIEPLKVKIEQLQQDSSEVTLKSLLKLQMNQMRLAPDFPKLVFQVMHMPSSRVQRQAIEKVIKDVIFGPQYNSIENMLENMSDKWLFRKDLDHKMVRLSLISLIIFPFIAPASMLKLHGIELTDEFFDAYLEHNINFISHGAMKPETL